MLNLGLAPLARGEVVAHHEVPREHPLWEGMEVSPLAPLRVEVTARMVGEGVLVRARLQTRLALSCRRCLEPVEQALDETVELLYEPLSAEEEAELAGEVYPLPERATEIDLTEALREQLLLRVPAFAVCREECLGLCPHCGADRNQTACTCAPAAEPGPWDALKKLNFD